MQQALKNEDIEVRVHGMHCPSCAQIVQLDLHRLTGVNNVTLNFVTGQLNISYNPEEITQKNIFLRVQALGYQVEPTFARQNSPLNSGTIKENNQKNNNQKDNNQKYKINSLSNPWKFWLTTRRGQRVILSGLGLLLGFIAHSVGLSSTWIERSFYVMGMLCTGSPIARASLLALKSRRADINLLMTISALGACFLEKFLEGAMVVFLFSLGATLQSLTLGCTRNVIRDLMDLTPTVATVNRGHKEVSLPISSIRVGEIITVPPGQRIPLDGKVICGISAIDQSPITGESVPVDKEVGDRVFAGTLNKTGYLEVETTHKSSETTMARIIRMVEEAQASRAKTQQWVDKFASIYTSLVIFLAVAIAIIPALFFSENTQGERILSLTSLYSQ